VAFHGQSVIGSGWQCRGPFAIVRNPVGFVVHHPASSTQARTPMSNSKNGNKEAKKPKKVIVPNAPGLPASLAPLVANPMKPKKR
jgi:hypothetical protein